MTERAWKEGLVVAMAAVLFIVLLFPALMHARRETRDGIRRNEIAAFKQLLEHYYNEHETYPLEFDAKPHHYVVTEKNENGAQTWYLRAQLENPHATDVGHDHDEGRKYDFRLIQEDGVTYYEVCGGTPTCDLDDPR